MAFEPQSITVPTLNPSSILTEVFTHVGDGQRRLRDGTSKDASFNEPADVAAAGATVIVADSGNHAVRVIHGDSVSTLAGNGVRGIADGIGREARFARPYGLD